MQFFLVLRRAAASWAAATTSALALAQPFTIEKYDVAIELRANRTMSVVETISTRFNEPRRGIIRKIPYQYVTGKGFARRLHLDDVQVSEQSDRSTPVKVWREGDSLNIRTGESDVFFPAGTRKTYVIRYVARGMLNWFDKELWEPSVELYWNLTGDQWDTNIESATFRLVFPGGKQSYLAARLFYGPYGSRSYVDLGGQASATSQNAGFSLTNEGNAVSGAANNGLAAFEGWTVVLALKNEAIPKPTAVQEVLDFIAANPITLLPLVSFLGLFAAWFVYGRDPKPGPMVVQLEPPHGLSAAQCGSFIDQNVDQKDIAAAFVELAGRGFVTMEIKEKSGMFGREEATLELTGRGDPLTLPPFERRLYEELQSCGSGPINELELKSKVGPQMASMKSLLYTSLVERGYYRWNPNALRTVLAVVGGLFCVAGCCVGQMSGTGTILVTIAAFALTGIAFLLFSRIMPRRTPAGVRAWNDVRGLEEFVRRARSDELDYMSKTAPSQALYEQLLPYAIAFGLTKEWTDAFRNIELHSPDWYSAPRGHVFNPYLFADSVTSSTGGLASAASTPPRSSGGSGGHSGFSSGGGFSGGGFGGGGGSSW